MGSLWKGERSNLGVGWVLGQIFFDEFSTALIFFLILKKAFFFVFLSKKGNNEKTTLCFLFFPEKKMIWWHFFNFLTFFDQIKKISFIREKNQLLCVFYHLLFFLSFMCWVGRGYFYLFMYCDWVGRRVGLGTKFDKKKLFFHVVVSSCSM